MREKAVLVLQQMEKRMAAFGHGWSDTTATQSISVHDIHPFMAEEIISRSTHGQRHLALQPPPVISINYEMDCRSVAVERSLLSRSGRRRLAQLLRAGPRRLL